MRRTDFFSDHTMPVLVIRLFLVRLVIIDMYGELPYVDGEEFNHVFH